MNQLPERAPVGRPLTNEAAKERARQIADAVDEVLAERATSHRDDTPLPTVGTALPVPQPGRPPMSQRATDLSALMLSGSVLTAAVGGSATAILWASGQADPVVSAIVFGAPAALALALSRLLKTAGQAAPPEQHHHYSGTVQQLNQTVNNTNKLGKSTTNI